jgi:hypothetical protein
MTDLTDPKGFNPKSSGILAIMARSDPELASCNKT